MKKLLAAVLTVLVAVGMSACGSQEEATSNTTSVKPSTVTLHAETGDNAEPVEVDISNMSNPLVYKNLIIDLPKGFTTDEAQNEELGITVAFKGSTETSTDCYTFSDTGYPQAITDYSKDNLTEQFQKEFEGFVAFESFTAEQCCGYDALSLGFKREIGKAKIIQKQYYIFADDTTYMIAYTTEVKKNVSDYEASIESVIVK